MNLLIYKERNLPFFDNKNKIGYLFHIAKNLSQLMYSVMMTGYLFKNAQYCLELQQSLKQVSLPNV